MTLGEKRQRGGDYYGETRLSLSDTIVCMAWILTSSTDCSSKVAMVGGLSDKM